VLERKSSHEVGLCAFVGLEGSGFVRVLGFSFLWALLGSFCGVFFGFSSRGLGFRSLWVLLVSSLWVDFGCSCVYYLCT
jgi:hypothetical protein